MAVVTARIGSAAERGTPALLVLEVGTISGSAANVRAYADIVRNKALLRQLIDTTTGEELGAFVPLHDIDRRLAKDRGYRAGREYRLEIKESRNAAFHRLAHVIGHLLVDNVEGFRDLDAHAALKQLQLESGICCETVEMDASPVVKALLDAAEAVLGVGARRVLAGVLPEIRTIPVKVPQSLAFDSMEEADFRLFFDGITAWIGEHYAQVMLEEVRGEHWRMVNGKQQRKAA